MQNNCSTGNIAASGCGGLVGLVGLRDNTNTTITLQNNYFAGDIGVVGSTNSGGMTGVICLLQNTSCIITIQNCNSIGNVKGVDTGQGNSGIFGQSNFKSNDSSTVTVDGCSFSGKIDGTANAGVFGSNCFQGNPSATTTIQNCHFTGNIYGSLHGGVFGYQTLQGNTSGSITINNCSASGEIDGTSCGGIIGPDSCDDNVTTPFTIQNCYSFCNFTKNASDGGGILGPDCGASTLSIIIKNCYSTGTILNSSTYAIIGTNTQNCNISNCVYNSFNNAIAGPDYLDPINNTYSDVYGVTNIVGHTICNNPQVIYARYEYPLHLKLLDTCPYQKQNKNLNIVLAFDICEPIAICTILAFVLNVCKCKKPFIYSKDMKFKCPLYWNNNNALYNGTLASGTYIIATKRRR